METVNIFNPDRGRMCHLPRWPCCWAKWAAWWHRRNVALGTSNNMKHPPWKSNATLIESACALILVTTILWLLRNIWRRYHVEFSDLFSLSYTPQNSKNNNRIKWTTPPPRVFNCIL